MRQYILARRESSSIPTQAAHSLPLDFQELANGPSLSTFLPCLAEGIKTMTCRENLTDVRRRLNAASNEKKGGDIKKVLDATAAEGLPPWTET